MIERAHQYSTAELLAGCRVKSAARKNTSSTRQLVSGLAAEPSPSTTLAHDRPPAAMAELLMQLQSSKKQAGVAKTVSPNGIHDYAPYSTIFNDKRPSKTNKREFDNDGDDDVVDKKKDEPDIVGRVLEASPLASKRQRTAADTQG